MHAFIPAWLDDYPFTPAEFRLVCHVLRRGTCWESVGSLARSCHLSQPTVRRCLRRLEALGVLEVRRIMGVRDERAVNPPERWAPAERVLDELEAVRSRPHPSKTTPGVQDDGRGTRRREGTPPKRHQGDPSKTTVDEVNPLKFNPPKASQAEPPDWRQTPSGKKLTAYLSSKRYAEVLAERGAAWCEKWTLEEIVAAWNTAKAQREYRDKGQYLCWVLDGERPIAPEFQPPPPPPTPSPAPEPSRYWYDVPGWGQFYEYEGSALERLRALDLEDPPAVRRALEEGWLRLKEGTAGLCHAVDPSGLEWAYLTPEEARGRGYTVVRLPAYLAAPAPAAGGEAGL